MKRKKGSKEIPDQRVGESEKKGKKIPSQKKKEEEKEIDHQGGLLVTMLINKDQSITKT